MSEAAGRSEDVGRCRRCGGRIAATHMLTRTYEVNVDGRWRRHLGDFLEDVVVVCTICGNEPDGRFDAIEGSFAFVPVGIDNGDGDADT